MAAPSSRVLYARVGTRPLMLGQRCPGLALLAGTFRLGRLGAKPIVQSACLPPFAKSAKEGHPPGLSLRDQKPGAFGNRLAVFTKLYVQVECSTQHGVLLCIGFHHGISHREITEKSHALCFGPTLFSPTRGAHALGGLSGDGLAAGAGRVYPSAGQAGVEDAPGQGPHHVDAGQFA